MSQRPYNDDLTPEARKQQTALYYALCDERDAGYARAEPFHKALIEANLEAEAARLKAQALARKVEEAWGPGHGERKRKIGRLADLLRFIPPRENAPAAPFRP